MNTRRKFLFNGSLATAALLATKPFTAVANKLSPVTGFRFSTHSLVLAHTGNIASSSNIINQVSKLKNNNSNLLMLHAGNQTPATQDVYDASMHAGGDSSVVTGDYKIIHKGDIKTGIIAATDHSALADINALALFLKKEKHCNLVVCLSQLGYKSTTGANDLELAAQSTQLDIIIGGHATNFCKSPMVVWNKNKEEVIINHAATEALALRKIEIGFDSQARKHEVAFTRSC